MTLTPHSDFEARFRASRPAEIVVATYLLNIGHTVTLPKRRMAKDFADRAEFADRGDIYASGKRIEVKHIKHDFGYQAWPFETAAICAKKSFDAADPRPDYYYIVNASMTVAALVDVKTTFPDWRVQKIVDRERGYDYDVYAVTPEYLGWRYIDFEERL
jgi:hypothetical protein